MIKAGLYIIVVISLQAITNINSRLVGGKNILSENEIIEGNLREDLAEGLNQAIENLNLERNENYRYVRGKIHSGTSQVVAGVLYDVVFDVYKSICKNSKKAMKFTTTNQCPADPNYNGQQCQASIWSRVWLPKPDNLIVNLKCL